MDFHNKFQFIGFNSIRGRYLYAALIFGVYLIAVAWFADSKVNTVLETTNANAVQHQRILDVIQQVTSDIWNLQNHIQSYLLSPGQDQQNVIRNTFKVIDGDVSGLDKLLHTSASQRAEDAVINLEKKLINLRTDVNKLLDIRTDPNKLFPAGIILREKMLPAHNGFISAVTVALEDAEDTFSTPQKKEVYQLLENIRYNWIQMIVAFRVYVANRSGIFSSNPKQGMEAQAKNISLFSHEIRKQLDQLSGYEKKGWLEFQQIESLQLMHRFNTQWQEAFQKAANIYVSAS